MMINDNACGIIHVSRPCFSVQGVIAGDNSFSIIHIAPTFYWEYCHTAAICLDLISLRRDGAEEKVREWRERERRDSEEEEKKAKVKHRKWCFAWKLCKHSSNVVCCRALPAVNRTFPAWLSCSVESAVVCTSAGEIFICRLGPWWIG